MNNKNVLIKIPKLHNHIYIGHDLDSRQEVRIVMFEGNNKIIDWINRDEAIKMINHLTKVFNVKELDK